MTVCELIPRKNIDMLIKAFKKANISNAWLLICGDGLEKGTLSSLITEENLDDKVRLLGFRSDVAELLHAADVFVFPTKQEGLPGALMEAMAAGLPCIASNIRGNVDLLEVDYAYLLNPMDIDAWAASMSKILDEKEACGLYCREQINPFDIQTVIDRYVELYDGAMKG